MMRPTTARPSAAPIQSGKEEQRRHPILRRWASEPKPVQPDKWLPLSNGVEVEFSRANDPDDVHPTGYRTGDYWLVPARTASGDVLWPQGNTGEGRIGPLAVSPHGVEHHYAPLAVLDLVKREPVAKYRMEFSPLTRK